ncbi:MAG: hypothetical protein AAGH65_12565, partial [Pseudomonadota bacterium]
MHQRPINTAESTTALEHGMTRDGERLVEVISILAIAMAIALGPTHFDADHDTFTVSNHAS